MVTQESHRFLEEFASSLEPQECGRKLYMLAQGYLDLAAKWKRLEQARRILQEELPGLPEDHPIASCYALARFILSPGEVLDMLEALAFARRQIHDVEMMGICLEQGKEAAP